MLNAAANDQYRGVVSIGPGAFEQFVRDPRARADYIAKFERNTGVRMPQEILIKDAKALMLPDLLTPCPTGTITVIHGAREENMLNSRRANVPEACHENITWRTIPFSDHMYGSESQEWEPIGRFHALLAQSLLMWKLNSAI